jgi:hypothetical protein
MLSLSAHFLAKAVRHQRLHREKEFPENKPGIKPDSMSKT